MRGVTKSAIYLVAKSAIGSEAKGIATARGHRTSWYPKLYTRLEKAAHIASV